MRKKSHLKKILCLLLTFSMMFCSFSGAAFADDTTSSDGNGAMPEITSIEFVNTDTGEEFPRDGNEIAILDNLNAAKVGISVDWENADKVSITYKVDGKTESTAKKSITNRNTQVKPGSLNIAYPTKGITGATLNFTPYSGDVAGTPVTIEIQPLRRR